MGAATVGALALDECRLAGRRHLRGRGAQDAPGWGNRCGNWVENVKAHGHSVVISGHGIHELYYA